MTALMENIKWFLHVRDSCLDRETLFTMIWQQYSRRILYFLRLFSPNDAEDLLQEVMVKIFRKLHTYNPAYSFKVWIYTIARNHALSHLRKRSTRNRNITEPLEAAGQCEGGEPPDSTMINRELEQIIDTCLTTFDDSHRRIAYLRYYEQCTYHEIAKLLAIPAGTVKSRLHAVNLKLRKRLEHYYADE